MEKRLPRKLLSPSLDLLLKWFPNYSKRQLIFRISNSFLKPYHSSLSSHIWWENNLQSVIKFSWLILRIYWVCWVMEIWQKHKWLWKDYWLIHLGSYWLQLMPLHNKKISVIWLVILVPWLDHWKKIVSLLNQYSNSSL